MNPGRVVDSLSGEAEARGIREAVAEASSEIKNNNKIVQVRRVSDFVRDCDQPQGLERERAKRTSSFEIGFEIGVIPRFVDNPL